MNGLTRTLYVCEDRMNYMYSAIYDAWMESREEGRNGIVLRGTYEQELFCVYKEVIEQESKAQAVDRLLRKYLGEVYMDLYYALLASDPDKVEAVLRTMQASRKLDRPGQIMEHLSHPYVHRVFELRRKVGNEAHFFVEFLRFRELENGILFAQIDPKSQVLPCISPHFADRFPRENWMIYDKTHGMYSIHEKGSQWILVEKAKIDDEKINQLSDKEALYQDLWIQFHDTIAIESRKNPKLQRSMFPLWYRKNALEFQKKE